MVSSPQTAPKPPAATPKPPTVEPYPDIFFIEGKALGGSRERRSG